MFRISIFSIVLLFHCLSSSAFTDHPATHHWYRIYCDSLQGANIDAAIAYLEALNMKPKKTIVVGIIDSGVDTASIDLKDALWTNRKEVAGDGKDNDRNGYVDDIHGWNFLGTRDGNFNMTSAGTEEFRQFKRLYPKYKSSTREQAKDKNEFDFYQLMKKKAGISNYLRMFQMSLLKHNAMNTADSIARIHADEDTLSVQGILQMTMTDSLLEKSLEQLYTDLLRAKQDMKWTAFKKQQADRLDLMRSRIEGIEKDQDKRLLMGDDLTDADDRFYGNNILTLDDSYHGTFVAGIVAGQGKGSQALHGVYPQARIMIVRAAPDGDEYDKDVATSIRYAVDNGAKVINMSIGKYTSPTPDMANRAIAYALKKDVIVIQAAGNQHLNIDTIAYFPTGIDRNGAFYKNFLRVGASDQYGHCSAMSNYGNEHVHLFAPGEKITSVTPGNGYATEDGTSVAAPVVSGIAALLRSYFPKLKAWQVCAILKHSCRSRFDSKTNTTFGIVDALEAVKQAKIID